MGTLSQHSTPTLAHIQVHNELGQPPEPCWAVWIGTVIKYLGVCHYEYMSRRGRLHESEIYFNEFSSVRRAAKGLPKSEGAYPAIGSLMCGSKIHLVRTRR